jgi:FkbM family methyltransferase
MGGMLRTISERFSRGRILKRRLPKEFNSRPLYVSPDAALRFWFNLASVDPALFAIVKESVQSGDRVWDIGANVGLFSFAAAALSGPSGSVLAIEADPWLAALLRKSAAPFPNHAPVKVLSVAVSDRLQLVDFNVAQRGRCTNFVSGFGTMEDNGSRLSFPQIAVSLDWLAETFSPPSVLKIDVEGMEHIVLRGAAKLLTSRPTIICEVQSANREEIVGTLRNCGYQIRSARPGNNNIVAVPTNSH